MTVFVMVHSSFSYEQIVPVYYVLPERQIPVPLVGRK